MIRHENGVWGFGGAVASLAMESLAIAMVEPAFGALLMAAVSLAPLLSAALLAASITAIRVTAIAVRAYEKHCSAMIGPTEPPTQYEIARIGHRSCRRRSTASSECGKIAAFWCLAAPETGLQNNEPRLLITTGVHYFRRTRDTTKPLLSSLAPSAMILFNVGFCSDSYAFKRSFTVNACCQQNCRIFHAIFDLAISVHSQERFEAFFSFD
jgi:hypothetical protein